MFLYRGGQAVEKGTYWEPNSKAKIVMREKGFLPAGTQWYYKLPECYFLIPLFLLALALSMAFPYGLGVILFGFMFVLYKVLFSLSRTGERLLGNLFAYISVRYRPTISFFSGSSKGPRRRTKGKKREE